MSKEFFEAMNSKSAFWLGLAGGVAVMFVIGFFILLAMMFGGNGDKLKLLGQNEGNTNQPTAVVPSAPAAPSPTAPTVTGNERTLGPDDAKITIIEFSDIQCPYCGAFHPTLERVRQEYGDDVRWIYRHFPLDSIHPQARPAAIASECVAEQKGDETFFEYLNALFAQQQLLSRDTYIAEANRLGVNEASFVECLDSQEAADAVEADYQAGLAAGVRGTPSSFINGRAISGALPYEQVKATIDALLN